MKRIPVFLLLCACSSCIRPHHAFSFYTPPPVPDYSKTSSWAALPSMHDYADTVPGNTSFKDKQADAKVDVFFIHPTSDLERGNWNADVGDAKLNHKTDEQSILHQATVFNGVCRIYAPRYRQATLESFIDTVNGNKALDLAYSDVKRAFQYYLDHYNNGRPVIIASHSQGTWHAVRLLHDFFDNNPSLRKQLVAAYLIGYDIGAHEYENIPPADSASQTGCVISWRSEKWGYHPPKRKNYSGMLCINPLTWKNDTVYAGKEKNPGGVPFKFDHIDPNVCDAQCVNGMLYVHKPKAPGYPVFFGTYHLVDYNLFYVSIRENVKLRVETYLEKN